MLGAAEQGIPRSVWVKAGICWRTQRILEYLSRGISVSRVQRQFLPDPSFYLKFGALSEGLLHVEELAQSARRIACIGFGVQAVLNLIVEEVIKIGCIQRPTSSEKCLLQTGFEGSGPHR